MTLSRLYDCGAAGVWASRLTVIFIAVTALQGHGARAAADLSASTPVIVAPQAVTLPAPFNTPVMPSIAGGTDSGSVANGSAVRGIVRSSAMATISAELNARISALPFRDGDRFNKGDILVQFDCAKLDADFDAAQAAYNAHKLAYDNQVQLSRYQAAGTSSVQQAMFEAQKAEAEMAGTRARRESCTIRAPFSGKVIDVSANAYEVAQPNQPLLKIVDDSKLELVLMVPSNWLAELRPQDRFDFKVDETGKTYSAIVARIGGAIEPISQSVRLIGTVPAPDSSLLPGMSGAAAFNAKDKAP